MAIQTTYPATMRPAVAGMRANMEPVDLISRTVRGGTIGFGVVVQEGPDENTCVADLDTTDVDAYRFLGITMREQGIRPETPDGFAVNESALIMRKGVIWVEVAGAVTRGTDVTVTLATGVLGSAAVGAGIVAIPNARWESSTSGAGLAKVRLG